jgi:hypothetical protein
VGVAAPQVGGVQARQPSEFLGYVVRHG